VTEIAYYLFWIVTTALGSVGWVTHLLDSSTADGGTFLIFGAVMFPVGVVDGWGRILGIW